MNVGTRRVEERILLFDHTIERVYQDLGLPMSDEYRELLRGEGKRQREHKTSHSYSLEEFGLEKDAIETELAGLFERFRWADDAG